MRPPENDTAPARQTTSNFLDLVGRLAPGATVAAADAELRTIHAGMVGEFPELRGESVRVAALQPESVQSLRAPLMLLLGAGCAVLLIGAGLVLQGVAGLLGNAPGFETGHALTMRVTVLAVAGLYGVLSYAVAQRTRELGIRTALGSTGGGLVSLVARTGMALVAAGVALGMLGGAAVTRLMAFTLYGVSPLDPVAWALAALLMLLAGIAASLVPALRATRADPTVAMRAE